MRPSPLEVLRAAQAFGDTPEQTLEELQRHGWHLISDVKVEERMKESEGFFHMLGDALEMRAQLQLDDLLITGTAVIGPFELTEGPRAEFIREHRRNDLGEKLMREVGRKLGAPVRDEDAAF